MRIITASVRRNARVVQMIDMATKLSCYDDLFAEITPKLHQPNTTRHSLIHCTFLTRAPSQSLHLSGVYLIGLSRGKESLFLNPLLPISDLETRHKLGVSPCVRNTIEGSTLFESSETSAGYPP